MSRLIVKNIPSNADQRKIKQVFSKVGEVTDCKIAQKGDKARKFCFIGYKTQQQARKAQQYFNNTYVGSSKVQVELAKTKDVLIKQKRHKNNPEKINAPSNPSKAQGKFQEYKNILAKGSKQSWNDLVIGEEMMMEQKQKPPMKKIIKQKLQQKQERKDKQLSKTLKKQIKIKAPVLSQKNAKFIQGPLQVDETRLYITNFSHDLNQQDLIQVFKKYGNVVRVKFPKDSSNKLKGFGFVTYSTSEESLRAFSQLDNKIVFGRILHVKPALQDIGGLIKQKKQILYQTKMRQKFGDPDSDPTSYKKKQKLQMRQKLDDTTSWNTLFLNPNTLLQHMADKHQMTKSDILLSDSLPSKLALAEAEVISETRQWMISQGLNLDFMSVDRNLCERSKLILLVKNLHHNTSPQQLKELFDFYGVVRRIMLCPNKAIAIVEFQNEQFAKNAFQKLSYYKFKSNPLFLEYAPINLMTPSKIYEKSKKQEIQKEQDEQLGKVLYVKNLNFETQEQTLKNHIKNCGEIRSVKIIRDKQGSSMGYAFIEFFNKQSVVKALKQYQHSLLEGHNLQLSISKGRKQTEVDKIKKKRGGAEGISPKLVVRNLAFQATKGDIKQLFKQYGSIKAIRLPKKMDGQHRGFGFVEYDTLQEAQLAYDSLSNVHLYGRKLVLEWEQNPTK